MGSTIVVWRQTNTPPCLDCCGRWICPEFMTWSGFPFSSRWSQFFKIQVAWNAAKCHRSRTKQAERALWSVFWMHFLIRSHYDMNVLGWSVFLHLTPTEINTTTIWIRTTIRWRNPSSLLSFWFLGRGQDADSQFEQFVLRNLWLHIGDSLSDLMRTLCASRWKMLNSTEGSKCIWLMIFFFFFIASFSH